MITSYRYKLRSSSPTPEGQQGSPDFILQTFKAEKIELHIYEAMPADEILRSQDFRGQRGHYLQASYQRLPYKLDDGSQVFSGTEETYPGGPVGRDDTPSTAEDWDQIYIDEDDIPGS
jgi:hypothetical protein